MGYVDSRLRAATPHEETLLDIVARREDLRIELRDDGGILVTGKGLAVWRSRLADIEVDDLYAVPMPRGWDR